MPGAVRIHDVAAAAGVSVTTVSHALNGRGKVSAETRERVQRVAAELGYAPNRIASALRLRRTDVVGLVSDEIATTPFAGRIVLGARQAAAERGMTLMLVDSGRDAAFERQQVGALLAQQVDALVYATMFHRVVVPPAVPASVPLVLVNAVAADARAPAFVPDEEGLADAAVRLLLDAGHRRIAHLTLDEPGFAVEGRARAYRRAMAGAGLPPLVVTAPPQPATAAAGRAAMRRALEVEPGFTAAFCFNDQMAMGVYQVAADRGLCIPEDLSVVGVDDLEIIAAELRPGLTTLALPHAEMGRLGLEEAVRRIGADEPEPGGVVRVPCPLVTRGSVAPPP